jgi:hypothetical protein
VGLEMSVGKAYVHSTYLNVNSSSTLFSLEKLYSPLTTSLSLQCPSTQRRISAWFVPFLNTGLFFNRLWKKEEETTSTCSNINLLLEGTRPGRQAEVLKSYIRLHSATIRKESSYSCRGVVRQRNLFLPICRGGMGVICPPGMKYYTSTTQKRISRALRERIPCAVGPRPLGGYPVLSDSPLSVPWRKRPQMTTNVIEDLKELFKSSQHSNKDRSEVPFEPFYPSSCSVM